MLSSCDFGYIKGHIRVLTSRDLVKIQYCSVVKLLAQCLTHSRHSIIVGYFITTINCHYSFGWNREYRRSTSGWTYEVPIMTS